MTGSSENAGDRARRRIALQLLPFTFLVYVVCYVDRANLSFANLRMSPDLGFSDRVYGLGSGIFFIGYVLFEIPGAVIVERWSAREWTRGMSATFVFIGASYVVTGSVVPAIRIRTLQHKPAPVLLVEQELQESF
jgi:MFS transporter, ACS family, tartrate transporter